MAQVYRAVDGTVGRTVAIKVLNGPEASGEEARLRFETEACTLYVLSPHRNIPTYYHYQGGDAGEPTYFVMEWIDGRSLASELIPGVPIALDRASDIICQLATVLDYAHARRVFHRDIKAGNVLLGRDGAARLIDFGIAQVESQNLTQTGARVGTYACMSPEQIRGETVDGASDQFSLGILAYRMLFGKMPFSGKDEAVWANILHANPPRASDIAPWLPRRVDVVLEKALGKKKGDRFESCSEFAAELRLALTVPVAAPETDATRKTAKPLPASRPNRFVPIAIFCISLLGLGYAVWEGQSLLATLAHRTDPGSDRIVSVPQGLNITPTPSVLPRQPEVEGPHYPVQQAKEPKAKSIAQRGQGRPPRPIALTPPQKAALLKRMSRFVPPELPPGTQPGGTQVGFHQGVLGELVSRVPAAAPPPPPPPPPRPRPSGPIRIGGYVTAAALIRQVKPAYPPLAKAARVQGTVKLEATIAKDGSITNLHLISGPPLLVQAAMQAVQQWEYRPTYFNGEAVDVITTIDVNFTLSKE